MYIIIIRYLLYLLDLLPNLRLKDKGKLIDVKDVNVLNVYSVNYRFSVLLTLFPFVTSVKKNIRHVKTHVQTQGQSVKKIVHFV